MVQCPDYKLHMTSHTLNYIHKKGYCKGVQEPIEEQQEGLTFVKQHLGYNSQQKQYETSPMIL